MIDEDRAMFTFKEKKATVRVFCEDIMFFESYGHYITVHMKDKSTYTFRGRLEEIDEVLEKHGFMRVHRGFIVNPSYVHRVRCTALSLGTDRESVPVSRLYKPRVYKELKV